MEKLGRARVAVFGLGAVGSFVTEALARSGVGNLRLIDFDRVEPSNLNRQLFALHSTVGRKKAEIARDRVLDIHPGCHVDICDTFANADSLDTLLSEDLAVVVDAIDGLNAKVNLLVAARQMNLDVVSSMGAGGRMDPSQIRTGDISETQVCPWPGWCAGAFTAGACSPGSGVCIPLNRRPGPLMRICYLMKRFIRQGKAPRMAGTGRPSAPSLGSPAYSD